MNYYSEIKILVNDVIWTITILWYTWLLVAWRYSSQQSPTELRMPWHRRESHSSILSENKFHRVEWLPYIIKHRRFLHWIIRCRVVNIDTCGSIPNIRNDGGTFKFLGISIWPKSTKNATHHTDTQSKNKRIFHCSNWR